MTNERNKEEIRPLYSELQGLLSQAPEPELPGSGSIFTVRPQILEHYHSIVENLSCLTGDENYKRFTVSDNYPSVYRSKLSSLISSLHGKYFSDEPAPFSGMPSTVNIQTQEQSQAVHVQMLLEVQSKIDQKLPKYDEGTKEKKFLQKVKSSLSSIKDAVGLIVLLTNIARECGLSIDDLKSIFSN